MVVPIPPAPGLTVRQLPVFKLTVLLLVGGKVAGFLDVPWLVIIVVGTARVWLPPMLIGLLAGSVFAVFWLL